ncbi:MAG: hypothetical protein V9H69_13680 [Anaerolineae bacterium]
MTHALTLELPEQVYETLMKAATRQGQRPEAVAIQWLATASESQLDDPFEQFIGAFSSNVPDWADRHDEYLRPAMLPEYDFSGKKGGRGKYHRAYQQGHTVRIHEEDGTVTTQYFTLEEGAVLLEPDVREYFQDSDSVNQALRGLIGLLPRQTHQRKQHGEAATG